MFTCHQYPAESCSPLAKSCRTECDQANTHDTVQVHLAWIKTPRNKGGLGHIKIPLIADVKKVCSIVHLLSPCLQTVAMSNQ